MVGCDCSCPRAGRASGLVGRAGVPAEYRSARTKPEIGSEEIDRVIAAGVRFGCVLADAGYGLERAVPPGAHGSRSGLGGRHPAAPEGVPCRRAVGLPGRQARPAASAAVPDSIDPGRRHAGPSQMAHDQLARGTKGSSKPVSLLSACASPTGHRNGSATRAAAYAGRRSLARRRAARVRRAEILSRQPAGEADLRTLAATIKARWICEQAHQQLKEELGLDHFEGRSWQGLHRHALMAMIAFAFLQHRRLKQREGKKESTAPASTNPASHPTSHRRPPRPSSAVAMPALPQMVQQAPDKSAKVVLGRVLIKSGPTVRSPQFPTLRGDAANMARCQSPDAAHGALTTWRHAGGMPARVIACFGGWAAGGCLGTSCAFLIHEASS